MELKQFKCKQCGITCYAPMQLTLDQAWNELCEYCDAQILNCPRCGLSKEAGYGDNGCERCGYGEDKQ
jgi:hypothetical protein